MTNLDDLVRDPCWLPTAFDETYQNLSFIKLNRDALSREPFLDERSERGNNQRVTVSVKDISQRLHSYTIPPLIFHSAFCCSTLLAKALDTPGTCLALKEPRILMSLANAKRMMPRAGRPVSEYSALFKLIMTLLARPHRDGEKVIVKATNSANNLLEDIVHAKSAALLMYASLEDFLISVLKKGEPCKSFIRTQYNIFTLDPGALANIPARKAMTLTDLQVASLVWRHQLEMFGFYHKNQAISTLQDSRFLSDKRSGLALAVETLGLSHTSETIQAITEGDVFRRDVKFQDLSQSHEARVEAAQDIRGRYADDLQATLAWAQNLNLGGDILPGL